MLSQQFTWALPLRLLSLLLFNFILQLSIESKSSCSSISFLAKALRIEGEGGKDGRDAGMPARSSHNSSLYEDSLYEDSLYEDSLALESILIEDVMFHMKEVITSTVIRTDTDDCDKEHQGQTVRQSAGPLSSPGLKRVDGRFCDWRHLLHMVDPIHKMEPPKDWVSAVQCSTASCAPVYTQLLPMMIQPNVRTWPCFHFNVRRTNASGCSALPTRTT